MIKDNDCEYHNHLTGQPIDFLFGAGTGIENKAGQWFRGRVVKVTAKVTAFFIRLSANCSDCPHYTKHPEHSLAGSPLFVFGEPLGADGWRGRMRGKGAAQRDPA